MNHPTPEQLKSYSAGDSSQEARRSIAAHLADCEACRLALTTVPVSAMFVLAEAGDFDDFDQADEHLAFEEIRAYIDGEATPALSEIIQAHVEFCEFCRVRVNDLSNFKAEVEGPLSPPLMDTPDTRKLSGMAGIRASLRTRLLTLSTALKTPNVQTTWLIGAAVTGAVAALVILRPHSEPKLGQEPDVTHPTLTRQFQQPVSPVKSGHKVPNHEHAPRPDKRQSLTGAKKSERNLHPQAEPHIAGVGQKTAIEPVQTGVNTQRDAVVKAPETSETRNPLPPLKMAEPTLPPTVHQNQSALSSSQPVQPTQKSIQPPPSSVLPTPKPVQPSPKLLRSLPQLALPSQRRGIHQEQTAVASSHPVQPSFRVFKSSPPATLPASQPVPPPQKVTSPQQIAVAPPQPAVPSPQPTVAVSPPTVHQNEPPVRIAVLHTASIHMQDGPIFAEDVTRAALGNIPNLNDEAAPEARMTPRPNSHMVVFGAKTDVWCPPGKFIELVPNLNIPDFKPVTLTVYDGLQARSYPADTREMLRVDPPVGGINRKVVTVRAFDAQGHDLVLMQCTVRPRITNPTIATLNYTRRNEQCGFEITNRELFTNACLYLGDMYLGRMDENASRIAVDERRLPPGNYSTQAVGKNSDDIYVPGASSEFTVPTRYTIECAEAEREIVIGEHADEKLRVTITHAQGLSIKKTRVYIAGIFVGEREGDRFIINLPTKDVPSGSCYIEVVGIGDDGFTYPVESIPIKIRNEPWEQRLFHSPEYERMEAYNAKIEELWQEVRANLKRADYEPDIYMDTKTFTLESITKHYKVGKKGEYQAAAERAFIQMTQYQLKMARVYRTMKMLTRACYLFKSVVREMGVSTPDGIAAKTELDALRQHASLM